MEISEEWDDHGDWDTEDYEWEKQKEWGWVIDAGKKVVMAGIVISSAPVLLPPLLLVSALGLAMSVPSGVVLASYACTHKLMTKLLPPRPLPLLLPAPNYQQQEDEEDDDDGAAAEMMSEDIKNEIEMRIELVDDDRELCYPPNKYKYNDVGRERELKEEREMRSRSNENNIHVEEVEDIQIPGVQVKQGLILRNDDVNHNVVHVMVGDDTATVGDTENEPKNVADNGDHSLELKEEENNRGGVNGGLHCHEELISEEKIWEKIDAIRVIVGFKAPRRSSYVEEVKALYLFTGIQPPAQDQSHLSHLTFLMSVIGLK